MDITFEQLPQTVKEISEKVNNIERLLLAKQENQQPEIPDLLTIKQAADFITLEIPEHHFISSYHLWISTPCRNSGK